MNLKNHQRNGAAVVAEALESRQLMAGSVSVSGGVMTITGTDGPNDIVVNASINHTIYAKVDGVSSAKFGGISRVVVNLKGGDDYFRGFADVPYYVDGGNGRDSIYGGSRNDTLIGGAGNDFINVQAGDDLIRGGDGNDSLYGTSGNDTLYGDGGDDFISGGAGNDLLVGGTGRDSLDGNDGRDTFDALDGQGGDKIWFRQGEDNPVIKRDGSDVLV